MNELTEEQAKAKELLELAGYRIEKTEGKFSLWRGKNEVNQYTYDYLETGFMMRFISYQEYLRGFNDGSESQKRDIKGLSIRVSF